MTTDRRLLGAALGIALAVAACGGSSASPAAASGTATQPAATQSAASEPVATDAASDAAGQPSGPDISFTPGAAGDLEAMLPSSVGTVTFTKTSVDGSKLATAGLPVNSSDLDPMLTKYGKTVADIRVAMATGVDSAAPSAGAIAMPTLVYAIQLKGVPASQWSTSLDLPSDNKPMTLGGKQVMGSSSDGYTQAYYTKDDVTFMVIASDANADGILAAMP